MAQEIKKTEPVSIGMRDPFGDMRADMDRMIETMFGRGFSRPLATFGRDSSDLITPTVDITENDGALTIEAELPGIAEDDVHVTVRDGVLTLRGEKKSERSETKDDVHLSERTFGSFQRAFRLPDTFDEDSISAAFDNGVLRVTLPKSADAKPEKRIQVKPR